MRLTALIAALVLSIAGPASAQEWELYVNIRDGFQVNFPGQPTVTETTWKSQLNYVLPARVYSASRGAERYSLTVVDFRGLEQLGIERSRTCPPGAANCRANAGIIGPGYWRQDERGAILYATFRMLQRDAKVTELAWDWQDMVEGHIIHLTNADGSRTYGYVAMHQRRLYILEGTVPKGYPEPGLFQQSVVWVDEAGNAMRYQDIIYSNAYHGMGVYPPPKVGPIDPDGLPAPPSAGGGR